MSTLTKITFNNIEVLNVEKIGESLIVSHSSNALIVSDIIKAEKILKMKGIRIEKLLDFKGLIINSINKNIKL